MELHVGIEPTSDAYKTTALTIELMEHINGTIVVPTAYNGIITIFRLMLSLDYIKDHITQIKICQALFFLL